jgi:hypothetical protein
MAYEVVLADCSEALNEHAHANIMVNTVLSSGHARAHPMIYTLV